LLVAEAPSQWDCDRSTKTIAVKEKPLRVGTPGEALRDRKENGRSQMAFCESNAILREYPPGIKLDPLPCKRWSCPECCHKRRARLCHEAHRGKPNTFLTLTVNPEVGTGPDHRARLLKESFTKIIRQASKQAQNEKIEYFAVFEQTKQGEPHLHVLMRSNWIDQAWISKRMEEEMGAPIVDIRRINNPKSASLYVSKYVSKNPERYPGCKRYWRSQNYFLVEKEEYTPPLGKPIAQWFEMGSLDEIKSKYKRLLYEAQTFEVDNLTEHWLVFVPPNLTRSAKDPPKSQLDLLDRPPQGLQRSGGEK
jgi:hypothetical protein